jgi:hypothetical protein
MHAGQDLDQGRLAGAIVAEEAMHLASLKIEGHAFQRNDGAEIFADILERDQRGGHQRLRMARLRT